MTVTKDVYIGCYDNYGWDQIKYLVNSLDKSGFSGVKIMVTMNTSDHPIKELLKRGWHVVAVGKDVGGNFIYDHQGIAPHVSRFFHMWNVLKSFNFGHDVVPGIVITTDVRDVVFQRNPTTFFDDEGHMGFGSNIVIASENIQYQNEPWGNENLLQCFGPYFHDLFKDRVIYNVGTIAGRFDAMMNLMMMIFQMSVNRPIPIVDQAVFNFLVYNPIGNTVFLPDMSFSATLGTTMDPRKKDQFKPFLIGPHAHIEDGKIIGVDFGNDMADGALPLYDNEGTVYTGKKYIEGAKRTPFLLVHQYDRVPGLKELIEEKFK